MVTEATLCPHCDRTTRAIRGICPNCGVAKDGGGPVSEPHPDLWRSLWDDLQDGFWWLAAFAPGLALLVVALVVAGPPLLFAAAAVLLIAPGVVKLLDDEW
jgi:hypothetical protein